MRDIGAERKAIEAAIEGQTLCSVFDRTVARLGDADALIDGDIKLSWRGYREEVRDIALGLRELGFQPGSFAVIMGRNRAAHVISDLATIHARGTPVSLYTTLSSEQVQYISNHCEAKVAFVEDATMLAKLESVRAQLPQLEHVVLWTGEAPGTIPYRELAAKGRAVHERDPKAFDTLWRAVKPDDTITLIYTSGTTGHPKGVIDTHRSSLWDLTSVRMTFATGDHDRIVSYLPLAHAADRFLTYYSGIVGGHVTYFCPDVTQILQTLTEVRPTFFGAVPRIWEKLHAGIMAGISREPDAQRKAMVLGALEVARQVVAREQRGETVPDELRSKRAAVEPVFAAIRAKVGLDKAAVTITGAAPTPKEVIEFFHAIGLRISEVWGMSELGVVASINPLDKIKIGSIGTMIPGAEGKLADDGELLVRGGMVMRGYYKEPDKTAETIDPEGWLATGDVATVDDEGYYTIIDRKKELIITAGGKNISPANIESMLKFHPLIGQACVIGDNRPYLTALLVLDGQVAPAWAAAHGISATTIAELANNSAVREELERAVAGVNERVSRVENIRRWRIVPTEWTAESEELTPTLKLKRRVILEKYAALIDEMYR
jgi:long-chain acyl-CoA synthetase